MSRLLLVTTQDVVSRICKHALQKTSASSFTWAKPHGCRPAPHPRPLKVIFAVPVDMDIAPVVGFVAHPTQLATTNFLPAPLSCFPVPGRHDFQPAKVCQDGVNWGFPAVELARPWLCAWLLPAVLKPFAQLQMCNFLE
jgi:hypothetical protein